MRPANDEYDPADDTDRAGDRELFGHRHRERQASFHAHTELADKNPVIVERGADIARDGIALHRVGSPQDVAALVVFLATCEPCYITGQDFKVDGFQYRAPEADPYVASFGARTISDGKSDEVSTAIRDPQTPLDRLL